MARITPNPSSPKMPRAAETFLAALDQRHCAVERLDPVRRWRRIRHGGGNRHRHRQAACARAGRRRTAHHLQICRARHGADAAVKAEREACHWMRPPGPVADGLRIGLLGGSFNPAHEGHLHVSEVALKRLGLDYVWWLVTPDNPAERPCDGMAPLADRVGMRKQRRAPSAHHRDRHRALPRHALHHRHADGAAEALSAHVSSSG